jgi:acyl transferase domain-containing protein/D-arabinose 1-dehydrogenase-like Zn-dependent alcohol dehydrogenase/acyl carrier protein
VLGTLRRDRGGPQRFLTSLAEVWANGADANWRGVLAGSAPRRVGLPTYPFQRARHWLPEPAAEPGGERPGEQRTGGERPGEQRTGGERPGEKQSGGEQSGGEHPREEHPREEHLHAGPATGAAATLAGARSPLGAAPADIPEPERERAMLELVRAHAAAVLGYGEPSAVATWRTFKELGVDSPAAVELCNRLRAATGRRVPAARLFDYPTPLALAGHLLELTGSGAPRGARRTPLPAAARAVDEPVAIVGMSCRLPGGADSPEELWQMLAADGDAMGGFPADRGWDLEALYDADPDRSGTVYAREGGFVYDAADFDAAFFGISPREALAMDPQQRLLLEACWEAIEHAGIDPHSLRGAPTGVFAGSNVREYNPGQWLGPHGWEGYHLTGIAGSVVSGRVAYALGLEGPAMTVDTACSASLVALHLACGAVRAGECSLALAGGVTVIATPQLFAAFSRQRALARDGRCKSFAAAADGTGWGEGAGVLLVERLSDARRNGHRVLAVVRGSAVNQDGASNGLAAPNGLAQQRVIRQALASAGLTTQQVDVVEAHGTGTNLGDPIEADALLATYGQGRAADRPLWLGSIKSNIGHTQAAAGVAGVLKMVLAMQHGLLPRTLHVDEPTKEVDWSAGAVSLLTAQRPWPRAAEPRRAGISSYGISGTNAHVILEEPPKEEPPVRDEGPPVWGEEPPARNEEPAESDVGLEGSPAGAAALGDDAVAGTGVLPWVVSGRGASALRAQAERLRAHVVADSGLRAVDIGLSLAGRPAFEHRAVVLGSTREDLLEGLGGLARGEAAGDVLRGVTGRGRARVAFLFTGQGAQRAGMGRELYGAFPVFARALDGVCAHLDPHLGRSLREVMFGEEPADAGLLDETLFTQTALFALEVALFRLLESWGVKPDFLLGHSVGELAAGHVAGVFSLADACRLVAARGRLMGALPPGGAMVAVQASEEEALASLVGVEDRVALAAVNGPCATVLSGDEEAVLGLAASWEARGRKTRRLRVSHAFHSPRMDGMLEEFERVAAGVAFGEPTIPIVSNLTGEAIASAAVCSPAYWVRHVRETVRFAAGAAWLGAQGVGSFLELGPDGVLCAMTRECLAADDPAADPGAPDQGVPEQGASEQGVPEQGALEQGVPEQGAPDPGAPEQERLVAAAPLLRAGRAEARTLLAALAQTWTHGAEVDWSAVFGGTGARRVELPTYAFQRERYWLELPRSYWLGDRPVEDGPAAEPADDGLRYRVRWRPVTHRSPGGLAGAWMLLVPSGLAPDGVAGEVSGILEAHGARVIAIELDPATATREDLAGRLARALDREQLAGSHSAEGAREEGEGAGSSTLSGVLSLLALDGDWDPARAATPPGAAGTLTLAQALGDAGLQAPLWIATRGAVSVGASEELASPAQGIAWGLGRVIGLEQPERWGGLLDLPAALDERAGGRLCEALAGLGDEDQLAVRSAGVFARRLEPARAGAESADATWRPRGTVLITGGTGGLGAHVARWLARSGAERILLASRRGPQAPGAVALERELAQLGVEVTVAACDVADREQLAELLAVAEGQHPLDAVFHAAGVIEEQPLDALSAERLGEILAAKAAGALHLHELTAHMELSAFVLFSSIASTFGAGGQGGYAAANAFLDALAEHRRARGLVATSVAWGAWAGEGMARGAGEQLGRRGIRELAPELALDELQRALDGDEGCLTVADLDWARYALSYTATRPRPLIEDVPAARHALRQAAPAADAAAPATGLASRLAGLPAEERERAALEAVRAQIATVLGLSAAVAIEAGRPFKELGIDSLAAVELRNGLQSAIGLRLPTTVVYDHPTPAELARHLLREILGRHEQVVVSRAAVAAGEPIAIVGMSCRMPGGVDSTEDLWRLLASRGDAIGEFPRDRGWDLERLYHPDPDHPGTSYSMRGGFLYDVAEFDPGFFEIGPREALAMDPSQRLLLEICWEAIEHAGIAPGALHGSQTGVFAGVTASLYGAHTGPVPAGLEGYSLTGNSCSVASGRIAYTLGLEGPAISVDTACSSSLVTLHMASQALRAGECELALAGGVTVMATPGLFVAFSRQRGLAPDGRCKSFADAADGTGWSEGVGMLVLERLSDAQRNGRRVLAVIRGSAVNQDGASNGLTAPNGQSQQRVIRQALANADLAAADIDAVEAHGTGTMLGDPIEAHALLETYGRERAPERPLWLGSVKSNIGHTQAAAGVAGVVKMVLALRHDLLPRTLHVDAPTSKVDWSAGGMALLTEAVPWTRNGRPRRAGVSSFGIGGTNAHLILEEAPVVEHADGSGGGGTDVLGGVLPWLVSGRGANALRGQAGRLAETLGAASGPDARDVGLALVGRSAFEDRAVVLGRDREELLAGLGALARGEEAVGLIRGSVGVGEERVAFLFTGQGAQRVGMGRELHEAFPVFREAFDEVCLHLDDLLGRSLREVVFGEGSSAARLLDETAFTQPALFALEVALFRLVTSLGVKPDFVAGHSVGELVAAHVAGMLPLEDACRLVAARARLMGELPRGGAMVAIGASEQEALQSLVGFEDRVALAAVNGSAAVVLSGEEDAVLELAAGWAQRGRKTKRLQVSHAFHSQRMDAMLEEFERVAKTISFGEPAIPIASNLTGAAAPAEMGTAAYWSEHVRRTVRFAESVRWLHAQGVGSFLELGPDGVLSAMVQDCLSGAAAPGGPRAPLAVPVQRPGRGEVEVLLSGLASAWVRGVDVQWASLFDGSGARPVELPTYAFQRAHYWHDSASHGAGDLAAIGQAAAEHPLLGAAVALAAGEGRLFTGRLSLRTHPWLADHGALGGVLLPGTGFLELALHAGAQLGCARVRELTMHAPLVLEGERGVQLQVAVGEADDTGCRSVSVYARPADLAADGSQEQAPWTRHADGVLAPAEVTAAPVLAPDAEGWPPPGAVAVDIDDLYGRLAERGLDYGPAFQGLQAVWRREDTLFAQAAVMDDDDVAQPDRFCLHPALLDSVLQASALGAAQEDAGPVKLPFSWSGVSLRASGARSLRARLTPCGEDAVSLVVGDEHGSLVATVDELALRPLSRGQLDGGRGALQESLFRVEWVPLDADPGAQPAGGEWMLVGDADSAATHPEQVADVPAAVRAGVERVLKRMQTWLAEEPSAVDAATSRLVVVTRGAIAALPGETVSDLIGGAVWGLVRSAQAEHPGRFVLFDVDGEQSSWEALAAAGELEVGEQVAIRGGRLLAPRLTRVGADGLLSAPADAAEWRLEVGGGGTLEELVLHASPHAGERLEPGQVRVAVRAAGVNFRDVLIALGMYPGGGMIGSEGAGIVLEVGAGVEELTPGDRVMGLLSDAFAPIALADRRMVARIPQGWSFAQAASVPLVFLTAYYALVDLAGMRAGERLLVHSAAGGVGMAAVQLARHLGGEVFGTASPEKWGALAELGLDEAHLASSRTPEFRRRFLQATGGAGMDVVLDCLAHELVDASLELLPRGGRFVEMGKTDIRDARAVAKVHAGVDYRAFDLMDAGPERIGEMLAELLELFERGVLRPLPLRAWDLRRAPQAFRFMSQARHVGKNVLTLPPRALDPAETVLVTGGTGGLGALLARHLASEHGARHLLLASRGGPQAPGAERLVSELEALGAEVRIVACDVADRAQLQALLAAVPAEHPLGAVVHAAGILDDGVLETLSGERLERVLAPKANGAWHLHELTADMDLRAFVLFSSTAATLGGPGQANYAAANAFLDALAAYRRARGLCATSIAWGQWAEQRGMAGQLGAADLARILDSGMHALSAEQGLELLDAALARDEALLVATRLDGTALRARAAAGELPALLGGLVRVPARRVPRDSERPLAQRLAEVPELERERIALELVRTQVAAVLGHASPETVDARRTFKDLGFDSLAAVELRNRVAAATGLRLPATLVFDHPTLTTLAGHILDELARGEDPVASLDVELDRLELALSSISTEDVERARITARLQALAAAWAGAGGALARTVADEIPVAADDDLEGSSDEEMFDLIDRELGTL